MTGERLARASLRLDAVYCIVLGVLIAATSPAAEPLTGVPTIVVAVVGAATVGWGGYVWTRATRPRVSTGARFVMVANLVASSALLATGLFAQTAVLTLCASVLAVDVAAFALSQGIALRRLGRAAA